MIFAVFSLGQLIGARPDILRGRFNYYLDRHGRGDVTGDDVWAWMQVNIYNLRLGREHFTEFVTRFNQDFNLAVPLDDFATMFNSMVMFSVEARQRIIALYNYIVDNPGMRVLLVSHTNYTHLRWIMDELHAILPNDAVTVLDKIANEIPDAQFVIATSMIMQSMDHRDILVDGLNAMGCGDEGVIVSFTRSVEEIEDSIFYFADPGARFDHVIDVLDHVNEIHSSSCLCIF